MRKLRLDEVEALRRSIGPVKRLPTFEEALADPKEGQSIEWRNLDNGASGWIDWGSKIIKMPL